MPGERIGDLSVLYEMEQGLKAQAIPTAVNRGAYYMSNWDMLLDTAKKGTLPSMLPADLKLPMVAPQDLGRFAAMRLQEPQQAGFECHYVEGPARYSAQDVADTFAAVLGRPVTVAVTPRDKLVEVYLEQGFSEAAADSFARMMETTIERGPELPTDSDHGRVTLEDYIKALVKRDTSESGS